MHLPYTICFIRRQDKILVLHRNREPNKGKWNGVGGKIEPGEGPAASCLREICEETGLQVGSVTYRGIVTFNEESGMYVFVADSRAGEPIDSAEGALEWKSLSALLSAPDVTPTIPHFLPHVVSDMEPLEHAFWFDGEGCITGYEQRPLQREYASTAESLQV